MPIPVTPLLKKVSHSGSALFYILCAPLLFVICSKCSHARKSPWNPRLCATCRLNNLEQLLSLLQGMEADEVTIHWQS
jgi:hypothetical protein